MEANMRFVLVIFLFLASVVSASSAEPAKRSVLTQAVALDTKKIELKFFNDKTGANEAFLYPSKSIALPMPVLDESGEFIRVQVNGKLVWVESRYFRLKRPCIDELAQSDDRNSSGLDASRGAGNGKACVK
jgi:hypothetical protein